MNDVYIIATDFDGTIVEDKYPEIGAIDTETLEALLEAKRFGTKLILWTCRNGKKLTDAVDFCKAHGLEFDAVNENVEEIKAVYGGDTRKVFANEYWDDHSRGIHGEPVTSDKHYSEFAQDMVKAAEAMMNVV